MKVKLRKAVVPVFLPYLFPLLLSSWLPLSLLSPLSTLFSFLKFESDDVPHNLELYLMPTVRGIPFSFHYTSLALNSAQAFSSPSVCIIPTPIYEKLNTVPGKQMLLYSTLDICLLQGLFFGTFIFHVL